MTKTTLAKSLLEKINKARLAEAARSQEKFLSDCQEMETFFEFIARSLNEAELNSLDIYDWLYLEEYSSDEFALVVELRPLSLRGARIGLGRLDLETTFVAHAEFSSKEYFDKHPKAWVKGPETDLQTKLWNQFWLYFNFFSANNGFRSSKILFDIEDSNEMLVTLKFRL